MIIKKDKNQARLVRHKRVRKKVSGTSTCPRLNVYRSLNEIYAQIIDDTKGTTLAAASSKDIKADNQTKSQQAALVGKTIAEGDVVCIVEAMKLMNEIKAECAGKVSQICVKNGDPVEFGQVLMYVE